MADRMCLRDRPPPFSPGVMGMNTLVATTTSSRPRYLPTRRPVATSLAPFEYVSAVSKKFTPPSTAARTIGSAASSSITHGRSLSLPKPIMPRPTRDTRRPVAPRFTYFIEHLTVVQPSADPDGSTLSPPRVVSPLDRGHEDRRCLSPDRDRR